MASMLEGFTCVYMYTVSNVKATKIGLYAARVAPTAVLTTTYMYVYICMTHNMEVLYTFGSDSIVFRCVTGQLVNGLQSWDD